MTQLDWTDVLDIGLPTLDDQHRKLISYSNSLIQAMVLGKGKDVLGTLFDELKEYTVYHFTDEERYMEEIGYPHTEEHKLLHKLLIKRVDDFRDKRLYSGLMPSEALDFINDWIIKHIMKEDARIGQFAKSRSKEA